MYNPKVTIVIPFYNRERTLNYCISSVLSQEYANWELLLIDDGSTDMSADICKSYCQSDYRIRYIYQDNQGAGPARNRGIEEANGEWITFVDSDDAIMPDHLSQLQKYGEDRDCLMTSTCRAFIYDGVLEKHNNDVDHRESVRLDGNKAIINYLYGKEFNPFRYANFSCWDKFFKMSLVKGKNIRFPSDIPTGQDQMFVITYFKFVEHFCFVNAGTYTMTPMGNEGIDHLACKLRSPQIFLYCQISNYNALMELATSAESELVREYAVNYILDKPLTRIILCYTKWQNRRKVGRPALLEFMRKKLLPIGMTHQTELHLLRNEVYRKYWTMILNGQEKKLYNLLFRKSLKDDIINGIQRRFRKLKCLFEFTSKA